MRRLFVLAVLLAAAYGVLKLAGPWRGTEQDEPIPEAGRPVPVRPNPPVAAPARAGRDSAAVTGSGPYAELADSLSTAIEKYLQRASDFRDGIIGCGALASGYANVDDAFVRLSVLFRSQEDSADARRPEYRRLAARADSVYRNFDASGCSRPA